MAYTIIRSDGSVLTTIQDGTINTTSTSLGLPGRNFAGYGQTQDTNFVRMIEHFANDTPPANPLRGQLWYNTTDNSLRICPADNTLVASSWVVLTTTTSAGDTNLGNVSVTGNIDTNNIAITHLVSSNTITTTSATVSANLTTANASISSANVTTLKTQLITTGLSTTGGTLTGTWSVTGNASGNGMVLHQGNLAFDSSYGVKTDNYMYANGSPISFSGTYTNSNVSDYLTGGNSVTQFTGNIAPTKVTTTALAGGGTISGIWTLAVGAKIQATYSADLAERYAADAKYDVGTVLELGGEHEVTSVKDDLSPHVFGVVSDSYAHLLNAGAGTDETHPPIALVGRVKVKVIGQVCKGQRLVSAGDGKARGGLLEELTPFNVVGRSLENKTTDEEGMIVAAVQIN
jgi:hypothetical protein